MLFCVRKLRYCVKVLLLLLFVACVVPIFLYLPLNFDTLKLRLREVERLSRNYYIVDQSDQMISSDHQPVIVATIPPKTAADSAVKSKSLSTKSVSTKRPKTTSTTTSLSSVKIPLSKSSLKIPRPESSVKIPLKTAVSTVSPKTGNSSNDHSLRAIKNSTQTSIVTQNLKNKTDSVKVELMPESVTVTRPLVSTTPPPMTNTSAPPKWPLYLKFDLDNVTEKTSKPDLDLLDKVQRDMKRMKTPIFKLKDTFHQDEDSNFKIPTIIHQSWKNDKVPSVALYWIKKWTSMHPGYTYMFWTDQEAERFIKQHYPDLWPYYNSWAIPVQKSDMFRVLAIYAFGGIWADLDMEPLKHTGPIRLWSSCILAKHPDVQTYLIDMYDRGDIYATNYTYPINAFFACRPGHPFMFYLLSRLAVNTPYVSKEKCPMSRTVACSGPRLMALAVAFYLRSVNEDLRHENQKLDVIIPASDWFIPTYDTTYRQHIPRIRKRCRRPKSDIERKICAQARTNKNRPRDYSYTTHHWFHSYNFNKRTRYVSVDDRLSRHPDLFDDKDTFEIVDVANYI